jgi:hypothetical protein
MVRPCWGGPPFQEDLPAHRLQAGPEHVIFALREQPGGTTRLLVRERYAYSRRWAPLLVEPVAVASFLMTQRMLRGIRDRAERDAGPAA